MIQTNRWHESAVDTNLFFQLQDITTVLSQIDDITFAFTYGSYIDPKTNELTASTLWETTPADVQIAGYKTDVYLRAIGTMHETTLPALMQVHADIEDSSLPNMTAQIFTLLDDARLEEIIKQQRPGTVASFSKRAAYLKSYFTSQLITTTTRGQWPEALFCMLYLQLRADRLYPDFPHAPDRLLSVLEKITPYLLESFDAQDGESTGRLALRIAAIIAESGIKDMKHIYFTFPIASVDEKWRERSLFDELTRTDDVANKDVEELDPDKNDYIDEEFSTWHRENQNEDRQQSFLQMDLDVGTKTNIKGQTARETESGDQVFGTAQGSARMAKQQDYSKLEALENRDEEAGQKSDAKYGEANIDAVAIFKEAKQPSAEDVASYDDVLAAIDPYERKLAGTLKKWLEHKETESRGQLLFGRLSRKLLPLVLDDNPRVFYKKNAESTEFDAIFTLMIDCSASMFNKMDETRHGVALFHEVLKELRIPHMIVGFWEAATTHHDVKQPNYFHVIHRFDDSLYETNGAKIMQLEAEEDNRDGFSIRVITEEMMRRSEKHKFLLVFSDGEPAAANYEQTGIVDTFAAVSDARKQGVEVIGMFLADGIVKETDEVLMENIYGHERVMVNHVNELPEVFLPILRKLIMKTIV